MVLECFKGYSTKNMRGTNLAKPVGRKLTLKYPEGKPKDPSRIGAQWKRNGHIRTQMMISG